MNDEFAKRLQPRGPRLRMPLLPRAVLLAGSAALRAHAFVNYRLATEWFQHTELMALRAADLAADPAYQPWGLRAIVLDDTMIGHIGFHTCPGPAYLAAWAPQGVEVAYTIYPGYRRRGFGREAVTSLLTWAAWSQGVRQFVAAVAPGNTPSLALARSLGFRPVYGMGMDCDEIIHVLYYTPFNERWT